MWRSLSEGIINTYLDQLDVTQLKSFTITMEYNLMWAGSL